jgi:HD superfamily phosphodiesterase
VEASDGLKASDSARWKVKQDDRVWNIAAARRISAEHLRTLRPRWAHVQAVGDLAQGLFAAGMVDEVVGMAGWLHDVGYAPALRRSGLHSLDGAWYLRQIGAPDALVALVA